MKRILPRWKIDFKTKLVQGFKAHGNNPELIQKEFVPALSVGEIKIRLAAMTKKHRGKFTIAEDLRILETADNWTLAEETGRSYSSIASRRSILKKWVESHLSELKTKGIPVKKQDIFDAVTQNHSRITTTVTSGNDLQKIEQGILKHGIDEKAIRDEFFPNRKLSDISQYLARFKSKRQHKIETLLAEIRVLKAYEEGILSTRPAGLTTSQLSRLSKFQFETREVREKEIQSRLQMLETIQNSSLSWELSHTSLLALGVKLFGNSVEQIQKRLLPQFSESELKQRLRQESLVRGRSKNQKHSDRSFTIKEDIEIIDSLKKSSPVTALKLNRSYRSICVRRHLFRRWLQAHNFKDGHEKLKLRVSSGEFDSPTSLTQEEIDRVDKEIMISGLNLDSIHKALPSRPLNDLRKYLLKFKPVRKSKIEKLQQEILILNDILQKQHSLTHKSSLEIRDELKKQINKPNLLSSKAFYSIFRKFAGGTSEMIQLEVSAKKIQLDELLKKPKWESAHMQRLFLGHRIFKDFNQIQKILLPEFTKLEILEGVCIMKIGRDSALLLLAEYGIGVKE